MNRLLDRLSLVFVLLITLVPTLAIASQNSVTTPASSDDRIGVLAEFTVDSLPGPTASIFFLKTTIAEGMQTPAGTQNGPMILLVDSGMLTIKVTDPVSISKAGEVVEVPQGEIDLAVGESALVSEGTGVSYSNSGDDPVQLVLLLVVSTREDGQGQGPSSELLQIADNGLAIGTGGFPPIAGNMKIERVVAEPEETIVGPGVIRDQRVPGWMGVDAGLIETGTAALQITQRSGYNMIWADRDPNMFLEPKFVTFAASENLVAGDGYAFYDSALSWTVTGDEPFTILRAVITPQFGQ